MGIIQRALNSTVRGTYREEEALRCIHVRLVCAQVNLRINPAISNALLIISHSCATFPDPKKVAFVKSSESSYGGSTTGRLDSGIYQLRSSFTASSVEFYL